MALCLSDDGIRIASDQRADLALRRVSALVSSGEVRHFHAATRCDGFQPLRCFHAGEALAIFPADRTAAGLILSALP